MATILNGTQSTPVPPGTVVRIGIKQASAEVLLSPSLLLNLTSWESRFLRWSQMLAENGSGVVPASPPTLGGDRRLSTQTLVVDGRTLTAPGTVTAGELERRITQSMPLGADLRILDLRPTGSGSGGRAEDRQMMADDLASVLPALPSVLGGSTGTSALLVLVAVGLGVFLLGRGARDLRDVVR